VLVWLCVQLERDKNQRSTFPTFSTPQFSTPPFVPMAFSASARRRRLDVCWEKEKEGATSTSGMEMSRAERKWR